jgi:NAD(P)-dependent dehydrogenase (short-subunit alcohol dehydrogenase family)
MVEMGLEDKVAVVTGANHGVGAATARVLATQKAAVFVTYLRLLVESAGVSERRRPASRARPSTTPGRR